MRRNYDLTILGATALAAGICAAHPELRIAVLETTSTVAGEFSDAMKTDNAGVYVPRTAVTQTLREEFRRRRALDETGEWLPAVQPILADGLVKSGADVFFFAVLKSIEVNCGGYDVTFSGFGIDHTFRTECLVDTTSRFLSRRFFGEKAPEMAEISLRYYDTDLRIRDWPCSGDIGAARQSLAEARSDILKIASELALTPAESGRCMGAAAWVPSAARGSFLAAFDDGAALALPNGTAKTVVPRTVHDGRFDVIVVGLGTAGAIAAVTAKEEGLTVLGLENLSVGGGAATAGFVLGYYYGYKGGVYRALDERAKTRDSHFAPSWGVGADQKITEIDASLKNCDIRYNAAFTDVLRDGSRVTGVAWMENGVRHTADARFVIDTSADSAVCVNAGCAMIGGRASDGALQPYSSMQYRFVDGHLRGRYIDNGRVNQYDPDDFGRGVLRALCTYLHLLDDYSDHTFLGIAPLIGLREGQRIVGEETVSFAPMIDGAWYRKPVYYGWSNLDNHGKDNALESRIYQDWNTICGMWGWGVSIPVPMGALIPKGWDGLLAAGRNVSVDHDIAMGLRMKDDVQKSGETAARLAALAIRGGVSAKAVDREALREKLYASGCLKAEDETIRIERQKCDEVYEYPLWCDDEEKLAEGLASDAPAYAMWSARALGKRDFLTRLLDSGDEKTRINAALTLTLLDDGSERVVGILTETALKEDGYMAKAGRKYIVPRSVAAVCALGRIAAVQALPALYRLMEDESFVDRLPFEPYDLMVDREDYRFQYRSHIITALCAIASAHPEVRGEVRDRLYRYVDGKTLRVSMMSTTLRYDDTAALRRMIDAI